MEEIKPEPQSLHDLAKIGSSHPHPKKEVVVPFAVTDRDSFYRALDWIDDYQRTRRWAWALWSVTVILAIVFLVSRFSSHETIPLSLETIRPSINGK